MLVVVNKVDDDRRETDIWAFAQPRPRRAAPGVGDPRAGERRPARRARRRAARRTGGARAPRPTTRIFSDRDRRPAERRASRRCSTGSSATSARSCTTCPARPATRSTPSSRPRTGRCASSTPRACAAAAGSTSPPSTSASVRALQAVDRADAALLVIDATEGVTPPGPAPRRAHRRRRHRDRHRAQQVGPARRRRRVRRPRSTSPTGSRSSSYAPVLTVSALTGQMIQRMLPALREAEEAYHTAGPDGRAEPGDPRRAAGAPAADGRKHRPRVLYATQGAADPPTFTLFVDPRAAAHVPAVPGAQDPRGVRSRPDADQAPRAPPQRLKPAPPRFSRFLASRNGA